MSKIITIGADPELFLFKDGKPVSCYGKLPGDKANPHPVTNGAIQVDGMAAEFNIDPSNNEGEFLGNIRSVMEQLKSYVPEYELVATPVAHFGKEYIDSQPEEAKVLGCEPDYNAWEMAANPIPDGEKPFRTGAGHVHIGIPIKNKLERMRFVRHLDGYLGLSSLLWDSDSERRELYGKAGAFRNKPYGVEYRTLSNAWLKSDELILKVYKLTKQASLDFLEGKVPFEKYGEEIQSIIDNSDVQRAKEVLRTEGLDYEEAV